MEFWAVDLVERVREGMRRYVLTMVDPSSRVAFAVSIPGKGARYTAKVLGALLEAILGSGVCFLTMDLSLRGSLMNCCLYTTAWV